VSSLVNIKAAITRLEHGQALTVDQTAAVLPLLQNAIAANDCPVYHLRSIGNGWLIGINGQLKTLHTRKSGFDYIHHLIKHESVTVQAIELVTNETGHCEDYLDQGLFDRETAQQIQARLETIDEQLNRYMAESLRYKLEDEREQLLSYVNKATSKNGIRRFSHSRDKARQTVQKKIKAAIDDIHSLAPIMAEHLKTCISTGYAICYTQNPDSPVRWKI